MIKKNGSIKINVDEKLKSKARKFAIKVVDQTYDRFKYNRKSRLSKIAWGKLGEEIFLQYLNDNGLHAIVDYSIYEGAHNTDVTDFTIKGKTIDLKVGTKDYHKRLLVVKQYFDNGHDSDYYVALNFYEQGSIAVLYGYAGKEEIKNAPVNKWDKSNPIEDYTILYEDLHPIEQLTEKLKKL